MFAHFAGFSIFCHVPGYCAFCDIFLYFSFFSNFLSDKPGFPNNYLPLDPESGAENCSRATISDF
jgi:hypothetical protein